MRLKHLIDHGYEFLGRMYPVSWEPPFHCVDLSNNLVSHSLSGNSQIHRDSILSLLQRFRILVLHPFTFLCDSSLVGNSMQYGVSYENGRECG